MADPRDELTLADMANDPNILRLTVRPEGVQAPPPTDTGWGGFGAGGRPEGRLFEPDQSPAPRPTIGERIGVQPIEGWSWSPVVEGAQALGRGIGGLVQGAGTALSGMSRPPSDLTGGSRLSAGPPSAISGLPPRYQSTTPDQPAPFERGARFVGHEIAQIPQQIRQGYEHSATSLEGPPELREPARRGAVERATDVNLNVAGAGMAGASIRGGASAGVFGGRLAKGFDPNREKLAQQMEANGVPPQQIWRDTGMVKFADGKWAHEIPDIGASYKGDVDSMTRRIFDQRFPDKAGQYDKNPLRMDMARQDALLKAQGQSQLYLPDVIDHPRLFAAYPELKRMPVSHDAFMHAQGAYYPESIAGKDIQPRSIKYREEDIGTRKGRGRTLDTLLHEIQHAIQQIEGMAKGSSTEPMLSRMPGTGANQLYLEEIKKLSPILSEEEFLKYRPNATYEDYIRYYDNKEKYQKKFKEDAEFNSAMQAYPRSAGENVAELPGQRRNMTPEQLQAIHPPNQFRVPMEQQFVEFNQLVNPAGTGPQAQMGGILKPTPQGFEGPQMSAGPSPLLRSPGKTMKEPAWQPVTPTPFLKDPQRTYSPGIYKNPKQIAEEAGAQTAKEHPALKELFGVTRDDLWQIGGKGTRQGNVDPQLWAPNKPGGSYVARNIMTPENAQRMIDPMVEARKFPELSKGMEAWYVQDPAFWRMVQLVGKDQAIKDYRRFNAIMTPFSSNSTVTSEINRGTAARMMADQGRFEEFARLAGTPVEKRGADFPPDLRDVLPHLRHGSHIPPVERWLKTGEHGYAKETVKNPLYTLASGVPETGFQTKLPVPDAHLARASGAADVRTGMDPKGWGAYLGGTEYREFGPWFRENVAKPLGVEAVPGQGLMWGTFAPQTGVKTAIGAPKLEILSQLIWERAHKLGIDPKKLRDDVLMGKGHALLAIGVGGGAGAAGFGSTVDPSRYQPGGT